MYIYLVYNVSTLKNALFSWPYYIPQNFISEAPNKEMFFNFVMTFRHKSKPKTNK